MSLATTFSLTTDLTINLSLQQSGNFLPAQASTRRTVTLAAMQCSVEFAVPTTGDEISEPHGNITATIESGHGYLVPELNPDIGKITNPLLIAAKPTATVQVSDDDMLVHIQADAPEVTEGTAARFIIGADKEPRAELVVNLSITAPPNFVTASLPSSVTIRPSFSSVALEVPTIDDDLTEASAPLTVQLLEHMTAYQLGTPTSATVTIHDNDQQLTVQHFTVAAAETSEGGNPMEFVVTLTPAATAAVTIAASTSDGTAISRATASGLSNMSADYIEVAGLGLNFNPGDTQRTVTVTILDDQLGEIAETFTLRLHPANSAATTVAEGTGTIQDNDPPSVRISRPYSELTEGSDAVFRVVVSRQEETDLVIQLSYSEQGNYLADPVPTTITIAANQRSAALTLATIDDDLVEADGAITLTIGPDSSYGIEPNHGSATVRLISDDMFNPDLPAISIRVAPTITTPPGSTSPTITEGEAALFVLSSSVVQSTAHTVTLSIEQTGDYLTGTGQSSSGGTAAALTLTAEHTSGSGDSVYHRYPATVVMAAGQRHATLSLATTDDARSETAGQVQATVLAISASNVQPPLRAELTVADNDLPVLTVANASAREADEQLQFVFTLSQAVEWRVSVRYQLVDGTARANRDYRRASLRPGQRPGPQLFGLDAGVTTRTLAVTLIADDNPEPEESFQLSMFNVQGANLPVTRVTGTILADAIFLQVTGASGDEGRCAAICRDPDRGAGNGDGGAVSHIRWCPGEQQWAGHYEPGL